MKPPSRQRSPLLATRGHGLGFHRILKQGQRDQRHPLQGDAAGIEAGDLLPGVRRVGV